MIKFRDDIREIWIYYTNSEREIVSLNIHMQNNRGWKIREHVLIIAKISFLSACSSLFRYEIGFVYATKRLISPTITPETTPFS